jgi:hypothetical protein
MHLSSRDVFPKSRASLPGSQVPLVTLSLALSTLFHSVLTLFPFLHIRKGRSSGKRATDETPKKELKKEKERRRKEGFRVFFDSGPLQPAELQRQDVHLS